MFESSALPERIYGLSVADGRRSVRPGETIRLQFRIGNAQAAPTPAARLTFHVPPGWTALDPIECELPALEAGREHVAELRARAGNAEEAAGGAAFQVELVAPDAALGSNVVRVVVRGRPHLDGPASALRIEYGDAPDRFVAVLEIVNDGDATARAARVRVPAPPGFALEGPEERSAGDIAPGAAFACSVLLRALQPPAADVCIEDAVIAYDGGAARIATLAPLRLEPVLAIPRLALARTAGRLDVAVHLANDGWQPAYDVPCRLELPPGWRAVRGTLSLDGAPVAVRTAGEGLEIAVPLIPPRSTVELWLTACAQRPLATGVLRVTCGEQRAGAAIPAAARRSLRLVALCGAAWAGAGSNVALKVALWNDGETHESILVRAGSADAARVDLRAGEGTRAALAVALPAVRDPGEALVIPIVAAAADGTVLASSELSLRLRAPAEIAAGPDGPGPEPDPAGGLEAAWEVADGAPAGLPLEVRLRCRSTERVGTLRVRPAAGGGCYVAGSTSVNGHAVVDGPAAPLFSGGGLTLHEVPCGLEIVVAWRLVPCGDVLLAGSVDADDEHLVLPATTVAVTALAPFAVRPPGLPFHIAASTLGAPPAGPPDDPVAVAPPRPSATIAFGVRLDDARRSAILRLLSGARGTGIVAHLPLLAALFPDALATTDSGSCEALEQAGSAVRSVYERLFVKLRIPGYDVTPFDLEDVPMRAALVHLLDAAAGAQPAAPPLGFDLQVELACETLRDVHASLTGAPLGGIAGVAGAAMLVPRDGTGAPAAALGAYAALLADELATARELTHDAFTAYVSMHGIDALDRARDRAIAALAADTSAAVA